MGITVFSPALLPKNETKRSAAASAAMLTMRSHNLRLSEIASETKVQLGVTWCGVMLIIEDHQHVLASSGGQLGTYRRATSLSGYVVSYPSSPFIVLDPANDDRFSGNPFVVDGLIGFYAGAAILDPQGYAIGAICVTSRTARAEFTADQVNKLTGAARNIRSVIW
jgi:GAF domain-containing protein